MTRLRNKLSALKVAKLTAPGMHSDGGGLYLRVRPNGTRSWVFVVIVQNKRREMGLGVPPDVSLADARTLADSARAAFAEGRDPIRERSAVKIREAPDASQPTLSFGDFFKQMIDDIEGGFKNEKHRKQWRSSIGTHAASLQHKPIASVSVDDVLDVLRPIWLKIPETASRVRGRIERILDAARVKGHRSGDNPARWLNNLELLLPRKKQAAEAHHAALPFADIPGFMGDLRQRDGGAAHALHFAILTAARSGEVLGCTWEEIDLESLTWTVPAERMKAGVEHQVPLSGAAAALLLAARPSEVNMQHPVFANQPGKTLSNMAMSMLLRRMDRGSITVHGFRSSFRDWAGETTSFPREDVEMALAHTIGSKAERAYRRGRALEKRRELMSAWAQYCAPTSNSEA